MCNEGHSQKRELFILRRKAGGIGGAELVVSRFVRIFGAAFLFFRRTTLYLISQSVSEMGNSF